MRTDCPPLHEILHKLWEIPTESRLQRSSGSRAGRRITCSSLDRAMPPPTLVVAADAEPEEEGGSRLPGSEEEADPHGAAPRADERLRLGLC
ncbi:hypothetical protein ZWY2020_044109 [Hordeum vulgare]|nr:hypothetical protein ZWY2020_044109 [Hordeum vulgare]